MESGGLARYKVWFNPHFILKCLYKVRPIVVVLPWYCYLLYGLMTIRFDYCLDFIWPVILFKDLVLYVLSNILFRHPVLLKLKYWYMVCSCIS